MDTVRKGTGRPAADGKRKTHAQKTALPPRKGTVSAAKEAIGEARKTVGGTSGTRKAAKPAASTTAKRKAGTAYADTKSAGKAKVYAEKVLGLGWSVKTTHHEEVTEVSARRGTEELWVSWTGGSMTTNPMPHYSAGGRAVILRNASECLRYAARTEAEASAAVPKGSPVRSKGTRTRRPAKLPFDPAAALDEEVISALLGTRVEWRNSLSGKSEHGWVPQESRQVEIVSEEADRTVKFNCPETGFRAFRLSALVRVGGAAPRRRIKRRVKK